MSTGKTQIELIVVKFIFLIKSCDNNQVWNLFSVIMMRFYQDLRHNKFCLRLFVKHSDNLSLAYINGHNALISGSYKHALAEYMNIHKQNPDDPLAAFCLSLGFTHLICQKFITNRHSVVVQLCAFLNLYLELRGQCQESLYNTGRALHQIGLVSEAVHFYKKALNCIDSIECSDREKVICSIHHFIQFTFNHCLKHPFFIRLTFSRMKYSICDVKSLSICASFIVTVSLPNWPCITCKST